MGQLWKDARKGRVILCDDRAGDLLTGVLSVALARVPKMSPDRTLSEEGRSVWDQRVHNEGTDPSAHPPALQPRHREVIRMILWWTLRLPGIPILLAKKDVAEAFKWIWIGTDDVPLIGADIPGDSFGIPGRRITAVHLCLTSGSPVSSFALADEVVPTIRGNKTDQLNEGNVKNHFRADGASSLCHRSATAHAGARTGAVANRATRPPAPVG